MSRNLLQTDCYFCRSAVALAEPGRATKDNVGAYEEYIGMIVADATCTACGAEYLAWIAGCPGGHTQGPNPEDEHFDLSFRSTFNDEPGESDYPKWPIRYSRDERRWEPGRGESVWVVFRDVAYEFGELISVHRTLAGARRTPAPSPKTIDEPKRIVWDDGYEEIAVYEERVEQ